MEAPEVPAPGIVQPPAPRSAMGTASLVLGITAVVLLCCLPCLSPVLGIVGLILGIMAIVAARRQPQRRVGIPVAGLVLSGIAMVLSVFAIPFIIGLMAPAFAKGQERLREKESHTAAPASAALWTAYDEPCTVGDVTIEIANFEVDDESIIFTMEIYNTGKTPVECMSLSGEQDGPAPRRACLTSDTLTRFGFVEWEVEGLPEHFLPRRGSLTIEPGGMAKDIIMFESLKGGERHLDLEIPGYLAGQSEPFRFRVPGSAWRGGPQSGEAIDVEARLDLARSLMQKGDDAAATEEFLWLWNNMLEHDEAMSGVRQSFMASDMEKLAKKSRIARDKFKALRDETARRLENDEVDPQDLGDWMTLNNKVLGDIDATVKWYDRVKDQPRWQPYLQWADRELVRTFVERNSWAEIGRLATDPFAQMEMDWELDQLAAANIPADAEGSSPGESLRAMTHRMLFQEPVAQRYAGLLAAGRDDIAAKFAAKAMAHDPSTPMLERMIETALQANQPRAAHKEWIAAKGDDSLKALERRVSAALR